LREKGRVFNRDLVRLEHAVLLRKLITCPALWTAEMLVLIALLSSVMDVASLKAC
jgi:hypothetical protein